MDKKTCSSCQVECTNLIGTVSFKCPECGKSKIVRCPKCRKTVAQYTCPDCGFVGPN